MVTIADAVASTRATMVGESSPPIASANSDAVMVIAIFASAAVGLVEVGGFAGQPRRLCSDRWDVRLASLRRYGVGDFPDQHVGVSGFGYSKLVTNTKRPC